MSTYQNSTARRSSSGSSGNSRSSAKIGGNVIGSVFLGICLLIGAFNVSGSIKKLSTAVEKQTFTSTLNSPSSLSVDMSGVTRNYLTEAEAAAYLNISAEKVVSLITSGEITEYIQTDTGYSISITDLDSWFENEVYKKTMENNAENAVTTAAEE